MSSFQWLARLKTKLGLTGKNKRHAKLSTMKLADRVHLSERLEERTLLTQPFITVTSLADNTTQDGLVTLREAIQAAETDTSVDGSETGNGADRIVFDPSLFTSGDQSTYLSGTSDEGVIGHTAFVLSTDITIVGPAGDNGLTIDRNGSIDGFRYFHVLGGAKLTLEDLTVRNGIATGITDADSTYIGYGGAIFSVGDLTIDRVAFVNNAAEGSGSVFGVSSGFGGSIYSEGPSVTIRNSTFFQNGASGGAYDGNAGSGYGGAVYALNGSVTIESSTFSGNLADETGAVSIHTDTAAINLTIANTILADSINVDSAPIVDLEIEGHGSGSINFVDFSGNIIESGTQNGAALQADPTNHIQIADPQLGSFGDNGGPTYSMPISGGSPALDAGVDPNNAYSAAVSNVDQRGLTRVSGGVIDVGAFEAQHFIANITLTQGTLTQATSDIEVSLPQTGGEYWFVVVLASDNEPTASEIEVGQASGGGAPLHSGHRSYTSPHTESFTGLDPNTAYVMYVVGKNALGDPTNEQTLSFTTLPTPETSVTVVNGLLTVTDINGGTSNDGWGIANSPDNDGYLRINDSNAIFTTDINGALGSGTNAISVPYSAFNGINLMPLGGDDFIFIGSLPSTLEGGFFVDGGEGDDSFTQNAFLEANGGDIVMKAETITLIGPSETTGSGTVTIETPNSLTVGDVITAGGGEISITARDIAIGAKISGTGFLTLKPFDPTSSIGIYNSGDFNIDYSDYNNIADTFSLVTIGDYAAGSGLLQTYEPVFKTHTRLAGGKIVYAKIDAGAFDLGLFANTDGVFDSTGDPADITANGLAIRSAKGVNSSDFPMDLAVSRLAVSVDEGDITFNNSKHLTIDSIFGVSGLTVTNFDGVATGQDNITIHTRGGMQVDENVHNYDGGTINLIVDASGVPGDGALTGTGYASTDLLPAISFAAATNDRDYYAVNPQTNSVVHVVLDTIGSGGLYYIATYTNGSSGITGMSAPQAIRLSPDQQNVYVLNDGGNIVTFDRDPSSGALTYASTLSGFMSPSDIVFSPDGTSAYVLDRLADSVTFLSRNTSTGELTVQSSAVNGVNDVVGLSTPEAGVISSDGSFLYFVASSSDAVTIFSRQSNGQFAFVGALSDGVDGVEGLNGARALALSPNGRHLYVAGYYSSSVAIFERASDTGLLTYVGKVTDGVNGVSNLGDPLAVSVSPDGRQVTVSAEDSNALTVFSRDAETGLLTQTSSTSLAVPKRHFVTSDNRYLVALSANSTLNSFRRQDIDYSQGTSDDDLVIAAVITAGTNKVTLAAANDVSISSGITTGGDLSINAGTATQDGKATISGTVNVAGDLTVTADGDITFADVTADSVTMTSTRGAIDDVVSGVSVTANSASFTAKNGIGSNGAMHSDIAELSADSSAGAIWVENLHDLSVLDSSGTAINLAAGGRITIAGTVGTTGGPLELYSEDINVTGSLSGSADLYFVPIHVTSVGVGGGSGDYNLSDADIANIGNFNYIEIGHPNAELNIQSSSFAAEMSLFGSSINVTGLNDAGYPLYLYASGGAITSAGNAAADIEASNLYFSAEDGFGTSNEPIAMVVSELSGAANFGVINISNQGDLIIGNVGDGVGVQLKGAADIHAPGQISIATTGSLTIDTISNEALGSINLQGSSVVVSDVGLASRLDSTSINGTDLQLGRTSLPISVVDPLTVSGTLTIENLPLAVAAGEQFVLVNNDGSDLISGRYDSTPNDTAVTLNGVQGVLSYYGGDGNDLAFVVTGNATIDGTNDEDDFSVQRVTHADANLLQVFKGGTPIDSRPTSSFTTLTINGGDESDSLFVDYNGTGGFFSTPLTFNAGGNGNELISTSHSNVTAVSHTSNGNTTGIYVTVGSTTQVITASGIAAVNEFLTAEGQSFTFYNGTETIGLIDESISDNGIQSNLSPYFRFANPTQNLSIAGLDGADTIVLNSVDALFAATLSVYGGDGADNIDASALRRGVRIYGDSGNDAIVGSLGDDSIEGGAGNDTINAARGNDTVIGGRGNDALTGGMGDDLFPWRGGDGNDNIDGSGGSDRLTVLGADTALQGETITLSDNAGRVTTERKADAGIIPFQLSSLSVEQIELTTLAGDDIVDARNLTLTKLIVTAGRGNDVVYGGAQDDVLIGGDGADSMFGGGGNDGLLGGADSDLLDGQAGDDRLRGQGADREVLIGGLGSDQLDGGEGLDIVAEFGDQNYVLTSAQLVGSLTGTDELIGIEQGQLTGGDSANTINASGFNGPVVVNAGGGNDTLTGTAGNDVLMGDLGDDLINAGNGNDIVNGGGGNDLINAGDGNDLVRGGAGSDTINGGEGDDNLQGQTGNFDVVNGGNGNDTLSGGVGRGDTVNGGEGDDLFVWTDGDNFTVRDNGGRVLVSRATVGLVSGMSLSFGSIEIVDINARSGNDIVNASLLTLARLIAHGGNGNDTITGGSQADTLYGGAGADSINGGSGVDEIHVEDNDAVDTVINSALDTVFKNGNDLVS